MNVKKTIILLMIYFVISGSSNPADSRGSLCVESAVIRATATVINPVGIERIDRDDIEFFIDDTSLFKIIPAGHDDEESFLMLRCPDLNHVVFQIEADGVLMKAPPFEGDCDLSDFHGDKTRGQSRISIVSYGELFESLPTGTVQCLVTVIYTEN